MNMRGVVAAFTTNWNNSLEEDDYPSGGITEVLNITEQKVKHLYNSLIK